MKNIIKHSGDNSYRFTSDKEPTEEQLSAIMKEVAVDVRQRAEEAKAKFQKELSELCIVRRKQYAQR